MSLLTVGQLSKKTKCTIVTLRYYEKRGLFPAIKRSGSGYRLYPETLVSRIYFIKNAKSVGFSLEEIKALLTFEEKKASSSEVKKFTQQKIQQIHDKINTLSKMEEALKKWEGLCDGQVPIKDCPILDNLYHHPHEE